MSLYGNVAEGQSDGDQQTKGAQFGVVFTKVDKSKQVQDGSRNDDSHPGVKISFVLVFKTKVIRVRNGNQFYKVLPNPDKPEKCLR